MIWFYIKFWVLNVVKLVFGNFLNVLILKYFVLMFWIELNVVFVIFCIVIVYNC